MTDKTGSVSRRCFLRTGSAALIATSGLVNEAGLAEADMSSGPITVTLVCRSLTLAVSVQGAVRLSLRDGTLPVDFETNEPLNLQVVDSQGATNWQSGKYSSVTRFGLALHCTGEIRTSAGSQFHFTDTYTPAKSADAVVLARIVTVTHASNTDTGFLSRLSLRAPQRRYASTISSFPVSGTWTTKMFRRTRSRPIYRMIIS